MILGRRGRKSSSKSDENIASVVWMKKKKMLKKEVKERQRRIKKDKRQENGVGKGIEIEDDVNGNVASSSLGEEAMLDGGDGKKEKGNKEKLKAKSESLSNYCEMCGESFESRNKLFAHLSETGHATLKQRARQKAKKSSKR